MTDVWTKFTGFLSHHANDLNTIASALSTIVTALPLDSQDKTIVTDGVVSLQEAATAIEQFLAGAPANVGDVTVKESDIETAVRNVLTNLGYTQQTPPAPTPSMEGNVNA